MSVSKFAVSKNSTSNRSDAIARRRLAAVSSASMIERLEDRRLLSATIGLVNPDILPGTSRLIFNYVQNPDATVPNVTHSQQTLQITDTGTDPLVISSMTLNGPWSFVPSTATYNNVTVNPGAPLTVTLAFTQRSLPAHSYNETNFTTTPNGGAAINGALTINSNDPTTPSQVVTLSGYWQNESNSNEEPSLQTITNLLAGYQTNINATPIPDLTQPVGSATAAQYYGSEVVSNSWEAADPTTPVALQELATFRTEGNTATVYWYSSAQQQSHQLFTDVGNQAQTVLPTLSNGSLAQASFTPGGAFGLRVDNEYSTDSINTSDGNPGGGGHHFRFFPLVDDAGNTVANTYLVAMDYGVQQAENFDFNDGVFIVSNIRPSGTPETPSNFSAASGTSPVLTWTADSYAPVEYNVFSSTSPTGPFTKLNSSPITGTTYTDTSNPVGSVYYQLTAFDYTQNPVTTSAPATASANTGPILPVITLNGYSGQAITDNPLAGATDSTGTIVPASAVVGVPNHGGTATVNTSNGSFTYTPAANFVGTETFTYTVSDTNGRSSGPVTVTAKITAPIPVAPVANNEVTVTLENTPLVIPVTAVDNPSTSFNLSSIKITNQTDSGTLTVNTDGTVSYAPSKNFVGGDTFAYTIQDNNGLASNVATVDINVGVEISSAKNAAHKLVYNDEDKTGVTVSINRGIADVYFDGIGTVLSTVKGVTTVAGESLRARQISLSGTTTASVLSITGKNKGPVNLGGISDAGPLGSISAPTTNLSATGSTTVSSSGLLTGSISPALTSVTTPIAPAGTLQLAGVRSITLNTATTSVISLGGAGVASSSVVFNGAVTDTSLTSGVALGNLKALSWINSNTTANSESVTVTAPAIANLVIGGAFEAGLTLNRPGRAAALGSAHVAGAASTANWSITGNAHSIFLGSAGTTWGGLVVTGNLASFVVANGNLSADISAGSINTLKVAGAITANITTTGNLLSLQAGQLVDSLIDVGSTAGSVTAATLANLGSATLGRLLLTSKAANTFNDSSVIAHTIGSATTGAVNAANGGVPEGLAAHVIKSATVTVDAGILHLSGKTLISDAALATFLTSKGATLGTFAIDIL